MQYYNPENRHQRKGTRSKTNPDGGWLKYIHTKLVARDKMSLDITRLRDKSLTDLNKLHKPDILAGKIGRNLKTASARFRMIAGKLNV